MKIKSIATICKKNKQVVLFNRYSDNRGCGNLSTEHGGNRHYFRGELARLDYTDQANYKVKGYKYGKIELF